MLQTSWSALLGLLFVLVGGINIWLIFHASSRLKDKGASARLIQGHRIGGYLFIMLFSIMTYYMILKVKDTPEELALRPMIHMLLALLMVPLIFVKVLVARYYKTYYNVLMPLGLIIFTLGFVLVAMTAGPYFLRKATIKDVSLESIKMGTNKIDMEAAQALMQKRCSKCHTLDRVVGVRKDASGWLASINRMRALPGSGISESDVPTIVSYMVAQNPDVSPNNGAMTSQGELSVGKGLVDTRCNRCHDLDRVYSTTKTAKEWSDTVTRMTAYSSDGLFKPGDDTAIIKFLSETQTEEATKQRNSKVVQATVSGASLVKSPSAIEPTAATGSNNASAIIVLALVGVVFGFLMLRRPQVATSTSAPTKTTSPNVSADKGEEKSIAPEGKKQTLKLQLARIEQLTPDAKLLRFLVPTEESFAAKPGQFLTFNWFIDGKKVVRSYTICSSATQTGYIEIVPKRVDKGIVSSYLNDKAQLGLTVEAKGPSGQFYFDETKHRRIVLLAAGSGITPMMAILRYIDDRCLTTDVTLIYSIQKDIIFEKELAQLKTRLPNFRYIVTLTKPDGDWKGAKGRLNSDLIKSNLGKDLTDTTFFLCGPKSFMDTAHQLLQALNVKEEQIKQESFGGLPATKSSVATEAANTITVEFVRSRKQSPATAEQTLLEVAEINGVSIPFSCRQGQCGTCVTKLAEGQVTMDAEDGLDPELKEEGYILTCVGHAKSNNVKLDV